MERQSEKDKNYRGKVWQKAMGSEGRGRKQIKKQRVAGRQGERETAGFRSSSVTDIHFCMEAY